MSDAGFALTVLNLCGKGVPDADISFDPTLTIVAGLSNTGKSYIYQCIRYMLGSSTRPKDVAAAKPYSRVQLELETRTQRKFVLERDLRVDSDFKVYESALRDIADASKATLLSDTHSQNDPANISSFLLHLSGFGNDLRLLKKKTTNETCPLTFRHIRPFFLIDEVRMISELSPVRASGQYINETEETATFDLMISGRDWNGLIAKPKKLEVRVASWEARSGLLQELIGSLEGSLAGSLPITEIDEARVRTEARIANAVKELAEIGEEVKDLNRKKKERLDEKRPKELRTRVIEQLLRQFELLSDSYQSDLERLKFIEEAANLTAQLGAENCPTCGQPFPETMEGEHPHLSTEDQIQAARAERNKLARHLSDLANTMRALNAEQAELNAEIDALDTEFAQLDAALKQAWQQRSKPLEEVLTAENERLAQLTRQRNDWRQLEQLRARLRELGGKPSKGRKGEKPDISEPRVPMKERREFCDVLESTLVAWKVPEAGTVEFDPKMNLIVGGVLASSNGKGVRAIINSAFAISLMRYCIAKRLPHPGVVVLDSPLTSYKEEDREEVGEEVQQAFYDDLANGNTPTQVIILENKEPPVTIQKSARYYHFTRSHEHGRYGFFPVLSGDSIDKDRK